LGRSFITIVGPDQVPDLKWQEDVRIRLAQVIFAAYDHGREGSRKADAHGNHGGQTSVSAAVGWSGLTFPLPRHYFPRRFDLRSRRLTWLWSGLGRAKEQHTPDYGAIDRPDLQVDVAGGKHPSLLACVGVSNPVMIDSREPHLAVKPHDARLRAHFWVHRGSQTALESIKLEPNRMAVAWSSKLRARSLTAVGQ
jgi:hypothetical protein